MIKVCFFTLMILLFSSCTSTDLMTSNSLRSGFTSSQRNAIPAEHRPDYCFKERVHGSRIKRFVCYSQSQLQFREDDRRYLLDAMRETSRLESVSY